VNSPAEDGNAQSVPKSRQKKKLAMKQNSCENVKGVNTRRLSTQKEQRRAEMDEAEIISGNSPAEPENLLSVKRSRRTRKLPVNLVII